MRRRTSLWASITLLAACLVAVLGVSSPPASADSALVERWCDPPPMVAPCVESFSINGVPQTAESATGLVLSEVVDAEEYQNISMELSGVAPATSDVLNVVINTGDLFIPDRMFGRLALDDVDVRREVDGFYRMRIVGSPVIWGRGCDADQPWPWPCPATAESDEVAFGADITMLEDRRETTIGMYVGTNAAFNGIFFEEQPDGTHALTTELVSPHFRQDGTSVIHGDVRYRLSYRQMRLEMGIPNPETLTPGSLSGTINNGAGGGVFDTGHDPDGGGFIIEASGFTFSLKKVEVAAAHINPTRPAISRTLRATPSRARIRHTMATPRGAKVIGYVARCSTSGGHSLQATGPASSSRIAMTGLRHGRTYHCRVAARSKAGPSAWSARVRIAAQP